MVEAVMFWNEPKNKSHWAFEIAPDWAIFPQPAAEAFRHHTPEMRRVRRYASLTHRSGTTDKVTAGNEPVTV